MLPEQFLLVHIFEGDNNICIYSFKEEIVIGTLICKSHFHSALVYLFGFGETNLHCKKNSWCRAYDSRLVHVLYSARIMLSCHSVSGIISRHGFSFLSV